jgi:D-tyrosyl-tRNA(Tyr) deacylase
MKILLQRVLSATVRVDGEVVGKIARGLLLYVGFTHGDGEKKIDFLLDRVFGLRVFPDEEQKMNLSLIDVGGEVLIISQFTLYANCEKGRRPSFIESMPGKEAEGLYNMMLLKAEKILGKVESGKFGAHMEVECVNEGPVNLILDF